MTKPSDVPAEQPERLDLRSHDAISGRLQELLRLFPEVRTEDGKLDFERLKLALGESVDVGPERFGMNWPGKADCMKAIQTPSMATLRPCPEESVRFDTSENLIIEGDNLEVLKLLQKAYQGKVKMIYIDPPYNTGKDFIYPDNYSESLQTYLTYTGQMNAEGKKFGTNVESEGRFHSKWMCMMYPRLHLARNLLREDGVIFIGIDDGEVDNLKKLCQEIFGEECILALLPTIMNLKGNNDEFGFAGAHEYTLVATRNRDLAKLNEFRVPVDEDTDWETDEMGYYKKGANLKATGQNAPRERRPNLFFPLYINRDNQVSLVRSAPDDIEVLPITDENEMSWRWSRQRFENNTLDVIISREGSSISIYKKQRPALGDLPTQKPKSVWYRPEYSSGNGTAAIKELFGEKLFDVPPKPPALLEDLLEVGMNEDDIVLDFFAGSGTTAAAAMVKNRQDGGRRRFILVQLPEPTGRQDYPTIAEITKERVRRVIQRHEARDHGLLPHAADVKSAEGFRVFKLAESNFTPWDSAVQHDEKTVQHLLDTHVEHIREGRSDADLLYEILLKSGYPLDVKIETWELAGRTVHAVAGGLFLICLDRNLDLELIRAIAERKPERVVCLDRGFAGNDALKTNAVQIFKAKGVTKFQTL